MATILDTGNPLPGWTCYRQDQDNPRDPRCKLHLQRICGTCAHFQGALRPGPGVPTHAKCGQYDVTKHTQARAWECPRWTRKGPADA